MNNKLCRYVQGSYISEHVKHQGALLIVWLQLIAKLWQNIKVSQWDKSYTSRTSIPEKTVPYMIETHIISKRKWQTLIFELSRISYYSSPLNVHILTTINTSSTASKTSSILLFLFWLMEFIDSALESYQIKMKFRHVFLIMRVYLMNF